MGDLAKFHTKIGEEGLRPLGGSLPHLVCTNLLEWSTSFTTEAVIILNVRAFYGTIWIFLMKNTTWQNSFFAYLTLLYPYGLSALLRVKYIIVKYGKLKAFAVSKQLVLRVVIQPRGTSGKLKYSFAVFETYLELWHVTSTKSNVT